MRDWLVLGIVVIGCLVALRRPWIGAMLFTWLSLMNPHRYTYGFAYDAPVAAMAAVATLVGLMWTRDRESPFKGAGPVLLVMFMAWMTLSWLAGLDPADDYPQWDKVMKVDLMLLVTMALLSTKHQILTLAWVCAASLALLGAKGGLFTILHAGDFRVYGPPETFIADNNPFALALVMTIPLVRFLQLQVSTTLARGALFAVMLLLAASTLGSHSRGGFLAIVAMTVLLWWRGKRKVLGGITIVAVGLALLAFMPDKWFDRMSTIEHYDQDASSLGRFSAWWVSWRLAFEYPLGVGFNISRTELFERFSPYPDLGTPVAHSIYFQALGNHGFVGLLLFVALWATTWWAASRIRADSQGLADARWCHDLASMCQVSLIGYLVGGAFLNLAYFDLPYNLMLLVFLTRRWLRNRTTENAVAATPVVTVRSNLTTDPRSA